ncbi:MAG TPA: NAD(P)H-binding protein [Bryobacteraceae bacterium]|nr:NAD(P)H-binding protein [Bryobacteraceae bacterium]
MGATGVVGREVVSQLTAGGEQVCALTRKPDSAGLPPQVDVVHGDLTLPDTLDRCLEGIDTVFLVWVAPRSAARSALQRIARRVRRIVFLSAPLKTPHPFFQRPQPNPNSALLAHIEELIAHSGREWTFLRPGIFAANALRWWAPQLRAGALVRWPYLASPAAPIHERDIAAVAVRALCEEGHAGAEYVLTGPQSLTQFEQLDTIGRVLGRSLSIEEIPPDEARRDLLAIIPPMLLDAWDSAIGQPAFITSTVEEITGTPPRTFLEWATEHADQFRA